MTRRMVTAVANPHVDILGHCTGPAIGRPARRAAAGVGVRRRGRVRGVPGARVAVEINCRPNAMDPPTAAAAGRRAGLRFAIDTDAHAPGPAGLAGPRHGPGRAGRHQRGPGDQHPRRGGNGGWRQAPAGRGAAGLAADQPGGGVGGELGPGDRDAGEDDRRRPAAGRARGRSWARSASRPAGRSAAPGRWCRAATPCSPRPAAGAASAGRCGRATGWRPGPAPEPRRSAGRTRPAAAGEQRRAESDDAPSAVQGSGTRQPSRPFSAPRGPGWSTGSWTRAAGMSGTSCRPSSSPWYRYAEPGRASISRIAARARRRPRPRSSLGEAPPVSSHVLALAWRSSGQADAELSGVAPGLDQAVLRLP